MKNDEKKLENQLLKLLMQSRWTLREDIRTEEALWNNIRQKINKNNVDKLKGENLSDQEFNRIKEQMNFASFYRAGEWLKGENGHISVEIQRGQHRLRLEVLNQNDIESDTISYEVIHQLRVNKRKPQFQNSQLDVMLLFNGLPLIHIELKEPRVSRKKALNQINRYITEDIFKGPLSMVQMFVVMNRGGAQYIAAPKQGQLLDDKFLISWLDENNQPIHDGMKFARNVLSIPQAHRMIFEYMVLDELRQELIVLRPYQIKAIQKIYEASKEGRSGFIWHTMGSGKTLTSYKVAHNLLKISIMNKPIVDKTIFLVDRKDLDNQTFLAYDSYSKNDFDNIEKTKDAKDLLENLLSKERNLIITTRQKLDFIIRQANEKLISNEQVQKLQHLRLAFVVDECHRTISSEKKHSFQQFFNKSLWYGFTGTPIFAENSKNVKGNLAATTEEQYGSCLHQYTVKEAIRDGSVLGFNIEYQTTISEEQILDINQNIKSTCDIITHEKSIPSCIFKTDEHKLKVIDAIINKSRIKFGMSSKINKQNGEFYEAILTTSSIKEAQRYYELFKEVKLGKASVKISEETKCYLPDFPKIAITYSVSENEEESIRNRKKMRQAMDDYNKMFGTNFTLENINEYNRDLNLRLARKQSRYQKREEQVDLVIVVDRLLTGFDAPCISTLFIDRTPQKPQDLIQAFSRTNRIFDKTKQWGNIVTFRTPNLFRKCVDEALYLYSNGGEGSVLAPTWKETERTFKESVKRLNNFLHNPKDAYDLPLESKKEFISIARAVNRSYSNLIVYDEYNPNSLIEYGITIEQLEDLEIVYLEILESLKKDHYDDTLEDLEVDYEWMPVHTEKINYEYLLNLMQQMVSQRDKLQLIDDKTQQEVEDYIQKLSIEKEALAQYLREIWDNILSDPYQYEGENIHQVLAEKIQAKETEYIQEFAKRWYVDEDEVRYAVQDYDSDQETDSADLKQLAKIAATNYKQHNEASKEKTYELKKRIRKEFKAFMSQYIKKLF